jgi:SAM-dependent methyltransferase
MKKIFNQYSKYYDEIYRRKDYVLEAKFIKEVIKKYSPIKVRNILSIGCGTCSYEIILAKDGFTITALDQSQAMLGIAKKKIVEFGLTNRIKLVRADAKDFMLDEKFDTAMELFNIFGYHTTNEKINEVLTNINRSLKSRGTFFFDCWYLPAVLKDRPTDRLKEIKTGEKRLLRITESKLQIDKNIIEIKFRILNISKNMVLEDVEETHLIRYWSLPELEYVLNSNGFRLIKAGNFLDLETAPSENNWNIFVIAQKIK